MPVLSKKQRSHTRKHIQQNAPSVVVVGKIFAHWCGHCQTLLPEWEKLVRAIDTKQKINKFTNTKYKFVEIEQSEQEAGIARVNHLYLVNTGHSLAIQGGFPTLFKITDGTLEYYNGPRTYLEMLRWYMSHSSKEKGGNREIQSSQFRESVDGVQTFQKMFAGKQKVRTTQKKATKKRSHTKSNRKGLFSFLF